MGFDGDMRTCCRVLVFDQLFRLIMAIFDRKMSQIDALPMPYEWGERQREPPTPIVTAATESAHLALLLPPGHCYASPQCWAAITRHHRLHEPVQSHLTSKSDTSAPILPSSSNEGRFTLAPPPRTRTASARSRGRRPDRNRGHEANEGGRQRDR